MQISVSVQIEAPIGPVWAEAVDFGSHHQWMDDALAIDFETTQRTGVGTILLVETRVGPLRTVDRFTITEIIEPHLVRGVHDGVVTGSAEWRILDEDGVTTFTWEERLRFPWFFGGRVGELIAKPILATMWRRNLRSLKSRIESPR